jgi:terminase small subunit-like protein
MLLNYLIKNIPNSEDVMTKKKRPEDLKPMGRPTIYNEALAEEICTGIASSNLGLRALCDLNPHWPDRASIFIWMRKYPVFFDQYTKAKEQQAEVQVDYMLELANEPHKYIDPETGIQRTDVPLLRVKMDAVKWQASKLAQKRFGDKVEPQIVNNELLQDSLDRKQQLDQKNKKEY